MQPDYNKYKINAKLDAYDYDRMQKYIGEGKPFPNASSIIRHALTRFLDYLDTAQTVSLDAPEK